MQTTTLSPELILNKKTEALNNQSLRKECNLHNINLIDENNIQIHGHLVGMTQQAYKSFIKVLGLPSTFTKRIESLFNKESKTEFINVLSKAVELGGDAIVNVHVNPTNKNVVGFSKGSTLISNDVFFNFTDKIIGEHGFTITDIFNDPYTGGTSINAVLDNQVEIRGLSNEAFNAGLAFKNDPINGIMVSPHVKRLWCANGCTTEMANETYKLNDLTGDSVEKFMKHLHEMRQNGFIPTGYADTVREANNTTATIQELKWAHNKIEQHIGAKADSILQMAKNEDAYKKMGFDIRTMDADTKKLAKSNQSIWSIANAMTWVATNADDNMDTNMQDSDRTDLQVQAGNLLAKKWDHKNPFNNPFGDLNMDDQIGLALN